MKTIYMVFLYVVYITTHSVSKSVHLFPKSKHKYKHEQKNTVTATEYPSTIKSELVQTFYPSPTFRRGLLHRRQKVTAKKGSSHHTKDRRPMVNAVPSHNFEDRRPIAKNDLPSREMEDRIPIAKNDLPSREMEDRRATGVAKIGLVRNIKIERPNAITRTPEPTRGVEIGVQVKIPSTPKYNLEKIESVLEKLLRGNLGRTSNTSLCPSCEEEEDVPAQRYTLKPAYVCDEWDSKLRLCILERNIGDTVTFYLSTGYAEGHRPNVTWRKEFHIQDSNARKEFTLKADNPPDNIIIGKKGYELRVSPVTEIDLGYNLFSATFDTHASPLNKVFFMIRIVPIDLGFVYVGETIELNLRSFVGLPVESLTFRWFTERDGERATLPSNMKTSVSGGSIKISELRQEQEGVLACTVYTNLGFLATKKRFLLKDLVKNNDILKSVPDHDLHFEEEPHREVKRHAEAAKRSKRYEADDLVEKALMLSDQSTTPRDKTTRNNFEYDLEKDLGTEESKSNGHEDSLEDPEQDIFPEHKAQVYNRGPLEQNIDNGFASEEESSKNSNPLEKSPYNKHSSNKQLKQHSKTPKGDDAQEPLEDTFEDNRKYMGPDEDRGNNALRNGESDIILNIQKIPGPKKGSAQEKMAKISSCIRDLECSVNAVCFRNNLKLPGYCKCLQGYYGVGIFCREDIWIGKSNFDDEFQNLDDVTESILDLEDNI